MERAKPRLDTVVPAAVAPEHVTVVRGRTVVLREEESRPGVTNSLMERNASHDNMASDAPESGHGQTRIV
jgi:hypothetical protein